MKVKMRKGLFETNSSSIHTLAVSHQDVNMPIPDEITLARDTFGWGYDVIHDMESKCNYIFEMCIYFDYYNDMLEKEEVPHPQGWTDEKIVGYKEGSYTEKFVDYLTNKGIEVEVYFGNDYYDGGIDHCDSWGSDINTFINDKSLLDSFLFNDKSFIILANDNGEYNTEVTGEDFDVYYKYN